MLKYSSSHTFLLALLVLQAVYAAAEAPNEIQIDHAGHLYLLDDHLGDHAHNEKGDSKHHELDGHHQGHCHGQIHNFLSPPLLARELHFAASVQHSTVFVFYYSLSSPPELRPPVMTSLV